MKRQPTLHEELIRLKAEEFLKTMGMPASLLDLEDEIEDNVVSVPLSLKDCELKVQKTIGEAEQFFARFGLTADKQEELFKMPMIQEHLDEFVTNIYWEREELERTVGRPRRGWDLLPFEKIMETEKILKKLPQPVKNEKIKEIRLEEIFDRSAEEQIRAIQERLSAALEDVQKAANEKSKTAKFPVLVKKYESEITPLVELPNFNGKQRIDPNFKNHYSEQLKIILPEEDVLTRAIESLSSKDKTPAMELSDGIKNDLDQNSKMKEGSEKLSNISEMRSMEVIVGDIEKMISAKDDQKSEITSQTSMDERLQPMVIEAESPKVAKKSQTLRPNRNILICALKSKVQRENEGQIKIVDEGTDENTEKHIPGDWSKGMNLSELPSTMGRVSSEESGQDPKDKEKAIAARWRQIGPRRFCL